MKTRKQRITASLYSLFMGDALSMPVHWFYRTSDITRYFPPDGISQMEAAPPKHPSSIMSLHSTRSGGRRVALKNTPKNHSAESAAGANAYSLDGEIVGDVILKGKRPLWGGNQTHYHHGMQAGDNTLNACCARLMMRHLVQHGGYNKTAWLSEYINFMVADPAQHPDTYAESYHRGFFANLQKGLAPEKCGAVTHDTPSMGALVTVAPLAFVLFSNHSVEESMSICCEHVQLTHPDARLMAVVRSYVGLLHTLLHADFPDQTWKASTDQTDSNAEAIARTFLQAGSVVPGVRFKDLPGVEIDDGQVVGGVFSTACYITDSWPSVCYLAAKYHTKPKTALLTNTNLGGENAHRGSVLGTLVGIANAQYDESLFAQLLHRDSIEEEVDGLLNLCL